MAERGRGRAGWGGVGGLIAAFAVTHSAMAQVTQTDAIKTPLPQPVSVAELNLVNQSWAWSSATQIIRDASGALLSVPIAYGDYYKPPTYPQFVTGDAISLGGVFKWRKEAIDPVKDAKTGPGYFSAKCGFSGEQVLMGGTCQLKFGWYNVVDPNSQTAPSAAEIYPFISEPLSALSCTQEDGVTPKTDGFCPLAWDNRGPRDLSKVRWTPKSFSSGDLSKDPRYKGGFVGFALIGAATGSCTQSKFSMFEHNQRNAQGVPWVTSLIYESTVEAGGFYLAFEDLPMPAAGWKTGGPNGSGADGDFNDYVVHLSGLSCAGGNQACSTGQFGQCSLGRTTCTVAGEISQCRPIKQKSAEVCDNKDNDCDGFVDNGTGLCPDAGKPNCFRGTCNASCKDGAFSCPTNSTCDANGRCVDACTAVSCAPGSICRNGACVGEPCAGVVCAYGTRCELGRCIDPCAGVTCGGNRVCDQGLCVDSCGCAGCTAGLTCGASGRCVDSACASKSCPAGQTCLLGACIDPCAGVVCPGGSVCNGGSCIAPGTGTGGGGGALSFGGNSGTNAGGGGNTEAGESGAAGLGPASSGTGNGDGASGNPSAGGPASGGTNAVGGKTSRGGDANTSGSDGTSVAPPSSSSSSCASAARGRTSPSHGLPLLAIALGVAFMRRRTRRFRSAKQAPSLRD
ncbi:MAG: hypothetical protein ABUL62_09860 [Myxococcales bacterium]